MILIVGLGNPGTKYENNRHNVGFMAVDFLLKKFTSVDKSIWEDNRKFKCQSAKISDEILLAKPLSFMNSSGLAVQKVMQFYKISTFGLYVIHDDLDLPLGNVKITVGHGSAGHKGVESIIHCLGNNNFVRIRVGIGGNKKIEGEKYVLSDFERTEVRKLGKVIKKVAEVVGVILKEGAGRAANRFN